MDYSSLGLKAGLEIHQQLATQHKLFCFCPAAMGGALNKKIGRKIRAVAGETGNVDPAALYEAMKGREFSYAFDSQTSCLVELDDEPPRALNEDALYTALQACKLLSSSVVEEIHVMRKTVADGSAVSGFQRTALVGMGGFIDAGRNRLGIQTVCLEEDSAPATHEAENEYRLDRLGVPLIEIATEPVLHTPQEVKEAAEAIGTLLRSLNVRRGIGSIRQDINISIKGGARVEIKGFQELNKVEEAVENEVARQAALLEIKKELAARKLEFPGQVKDVTEMFRATECNFVRKALQQKGKVVAGVLPGFAGLMKKQCGSVTLGKELSNYAAAYGYGIVHSEEDVKKFSLDKEFEALGKEISAGKEDVIFISAGAEPGKAVSAVMERAAYCLVGVPEETRIASEAGSRYTRPLPGAERMYPETDVPVKSTRSIHVIKPETLGQKESRLAELMPPQLAAQMVRSEYYNFFEEARKKFGVDAVTIATVLLSAMKEIQRKGLDHSRITEDELEKLFAYVATNQIPKSSITRALEAVASGKTMEQVAKEMKPLMDSELKNIVADIAQKNKARKESVIMGMIMARVAGRAEGSRVSKLLSEALKK